MAAEKNPAAEIERLQNQIENLRRRLYIAIRSACPGPHHPQQHRDGKPPWCSSCRRTATGHLVDKVKTATEMLLEHREREKAEQDDRFARSAEQDRHTGVVRPNPDGGETA